MARNSETGHRQGESSRAGEVDWLRCFWVMQNFACSVQYFPLTLTFSLPPSRRAKAPLRRDGGREREQQASHSCLANGCWADSGTGVIERRRTILPLPRGEYLFSVAEVVALRRVAPRPAA